MRISKRELLAYAFISESLGKRGATFGEAIDLISSGLCLSKASSMRVLRRLAKLGLIRITGKPGSLMVSVNDIMEVLAPLARSYARDRCERHKGRR